MYQLYRVSGIKGSGFSHPPRLLAPKENNAHSASGGEGNRAAKADGSDGPGEHSFAQHTCLRSHPSHPGWLDPLSRMKKSAT